MKDAKGNTVEVGTPLYANLGDYGPCATIVDYRNGLVYVQYNNERKPFPMTLHSLENSYWSATRTWWQGIKAEFRERWWYSFRYELKKALATYKD